MTTLELDLSAIPLEQIALLRDAAGEQMSKRQCPSRLSGHPRCVKEKGHDGLHRVTSYATSADRPARAGVKAEVQWEEPEFTGMDELGRAIREDGSLIASSDTRPGHRAEQCPVIGGCLRCRSVIHG